MKPLISVLALTLAMLAHTAVYADEVPQRPVAALEAEVSLGRTLFFDKRLSRTGAVSCATCHDPTLSFTDGQAVSTGIGGRHGTRNSPTVLVAARSPLLFWDGRAASLEAQAAGPLTNPVEMDADLPWVVGTIASDPTYRQRFQAAYGTSPDEKGLLAALAAYQRALVPGPSPYDRYVAGDPTALTPAAERGLKVFTRNRCFGCHRGPDLTDNLFHSVGWGVDQPSPDVGRQAVTGKDKDFAAFKTPTLRNIAETAPYFHDGRAATLEAVVDYYNQGGHPHAQLDFRVRKLNLSTEQRSDLVTFLRALSGGHTEAAVAQPTPPTVTQSTPAP